MSGTALLLKELANLPGGVGDFWASVASEEGRRMAQTFAQSAALSALSAQMSVPEVLVTPGAWTLHPHLTLNWKTQQVLLVDDTLRATAEELLGSPEDWIGIVNSAHDHPEWVLLGEEQGIFEDGIGRLIVVDGTGIPLPLRGVHWLLTCPADILTTRLTTPDGRTLLRGIDFEAGPGLLLLDFDPSDVWSSGTMTAGGFTRTKNPILPALGIDRPYAAGLWTLRHHRGSWGPESFRRAMAEAAGLHVWEHDALVLHREDLAVGAWYWTDKGEAELPYPHELLLSGQAVRRGDVVGDVEVLASSGEIVVSYDADQLAGAFLSRAQKFAYTESPLGMTVNFQPMV